MSRPQPARAIRLLALGTAAACIVAACGPQAVPGSVGPERSGQAAHAVAVPPLRGHVEFGPSPARGAQALMTEVAYGATVSLIDADGGKTIASSVSEPDGRFNLSFGSGFVPQNGKPYFLEAVKGLRSGGDANRAGAAAARVRTLAVFNGEWKSLTSGGIIIGSASTALAIAAAYRNLQAAEQQALIEKISGSAFDASGTSIAVEDFDRVLVLVKEALGDDHDPVAAIAYDPAGATPAARFTRAVGQTVLHGRMVPAKPQRGGTVKFFGQSLPAAGAATPSIFLGDVEVTTWSVDASRSELVLTVPSGARCGYLRVVSGPATWLGPLVPVAGTTCTLAGGNGVGYSDGFGRLARFSYPAGIQVDRDGNVFVSEWDGNRIRKIAYNGLVTTLAGDGNPGRIDGTGMAAQFNRPRNLGIDARGNLYAADWNTYRVRRITPDGVVSTLNQRAEFIQNPEDVTGGALFQMEAVPSAVAVDAAGNVFIAEYTDGVWGAGGKGNVIWKVTPGVGITKFVGEYGFYPNVHDGTGVAARLSAPDGMAFGPDGYLYSVSNGWNHMKRISPQGVTESLFSNGSFAQNTGGAYPGTLYTQVGWWAAADPAGNVYAPNGNVILRVPAGGGAVEIAAGTKGQPAGFADGDLADVRFGGHLPQATFGPGGALYYTDAVNNAVRVIVP